MTHASGTVFRAGKKEFIPYATVKAFKDKHTLYTTAGEFGHFSLDLPEKGKWSFMAFEKGSYASNTVPVEIGGDKEDIKLYLDRVGEQVDEKKGMTFFWIMVGILAAVIAFYLVAHLYLFGRGQPFSIWTEDPLRYMEILLWGLAGILVSKIFITGWYLRTRRFYREGIVMHIAHLVATPIFVLVIVLLLSTATMSLTINDTNTISLDLSTPTIMIAFSFIIGTSPWVLWNFILNAAKQFTGQTD